MQPLYAVDQKVSSENAVKPSTGNQSLTVDLSNREGPPPQKETAARLGQPDGGKTIGKAENLQRESYSDRGAFATANSARVAADVAWLRRHLIADCGELLASLGVSLAEAAWRGDDVMTEAHLRQIIATTKAAAKTFREIAPTATVGGEQ